MPVAASLPFPSAEGCKPTRHAPAGSRRREPEHRTPLPGSRRAYGRHDGRSRGQPRVVVAAGTALAASIHLSAAELTPATVAAFNRYVSVSEAERSAETTFLWIDADHAARRKAREELRRGGLAIERLETRERGRDLPVPDGLVHHWVGAIFVPGATVDQALTLLQDYDRHHEIYAPAVARSRLVSRNGDTFKPFLRFFMKKVIPVVVNSDHEAVFTWHDATRAQSRIYSTRIAEVQNPGTPQERERPVGHDGGYLWRLNSYWRFLQRDGGVYLQCESITLTRGIPCGVGWIVRPFVTSIPRETLTFTLETTCKTLQDQARR